MNEMIKEYSFGIFRTDRKIIIKAENMRLAEKALKEEIENNKYPHYDYWNLIYCQVPDPNYKFLNKELVEEIKLPEIKKFRIR